MAAVTTPAPTTSGLPATSPGVVAGLVAAGLAGLAALGVAPLAAGVFAVQVVIALAWLATLDARGGLGAFVVVVLTAAGCDIAVATSDTPDIGRAAVVIGLALLASLVHQLARRPRLGVTMSIAGTMSAAAFALCAACYVALRVESGGDAADIAALLGAGIALAAARLVDLVLPRPAILRGSRRGVTGLVVGLVLATITGWLYGSGSDAMSGDHGFRIALVAALLALIADLAVDAVLTAAPPAFTRAASALPPLGMLLPVSMAGPAVYVAGRILLG
jgi:hypothetical protein